MTLLLVPLLAACIVAAAASTPLVLVDSVQHSYIRHGSDVALQQSSASALVAAATGLMPGSAIGADLSRQLAAIFKPSALSKPKAFVTLNVGGLSAGAVGDLFGQRAHRTVELTGDGCPMKALIDGLTLISAANPTTQLSIVDQMGIQNCKEGCLEEHLAAVVADVQLDLSGLEQSQQEVKLFVAELASVYAGLKGQVAAVQQRKDLKVQQEDVELYEVSILGMHALVKKYGQDAPEVTAATAAVAKLLQWAVQSIDGVYDGDVVYQMLVSQQGPARVQTLAHLANWKDMTRRQLQQAATYPPADQATAAQTFSVKAAGYGSFILLLYFSVAAIWCMCNMPFKRDSLLYGSKKDQ